MVGHWVICGGRGAYIVTQMGSTIATCDLPLQDIFPIYSLYSSHILPICFHHCNMRSAPPTYTHYIRPWKRMCICLMYTPIHPPPVLKGYLPLLWQRLDLNKPQIFANIVPINFAQLWHLVKNSVQQHRSLFHQLLAFLSSCYGKLAEPGTKHKIWKTWQSLQKNWQKCAWPQNLSSGGIPAFLMYALPHHQQGSIDFNKSGYIGLVKNFIHALYDHKREFVKR